MKRPNLVIGASVSAAVALAALLTPLLPLVNPLAQDLPHEFAGPVPGHWLGFGENGVDVLSQVLWGARFSLGIGLAATLVTAVIGVSLGMIAAYRGGWLGALIMRSVDVLYAFPGILLIVALAAFLGPSARNLFVALTVTSWIGYARMARAQCLSLMNRDFVHAARAVGAPDWRVLAFHVFPSMLGPTLVQMTYGLGAMIMAESSLSFLGLGAPGSYPSWGEMLNQGREVMLTATHLVIIPGVALMTTLLAFNLLGDGLRDFFDPKMR